MYRPTNLKNVIKDIFQNNIIALLIISILFLIFAPPIGVDFSLLHPAARAIFEWRNPYTAAPHFYNPPWMLIFLAPLGLMSLQIGRWAWAIAGIAGYFIAFKRLKFDQITTLLLFISPFVYFDLGIGNYEWLILLGITLPPALGSWIAFLKPQMSLWWIALWVRRGKFIVILPVIACILLIVIGVYSLPKRQEMPWSMDIFPYGVPVGLWLLYVAFKKDDLFFAMAAGPFLSPYVATQSWIFALLPLIKNKWALLAGVLLGWVLVCISI